MDGFVYSLGTRYGFAPFLALQLHYESRLSGATHKHEESVMSIQVAPLPTEDNRPMATVAAAEFCGISRSMMVKLRLSGKGPTFLRVKNRVLYLPSDLMDWLYSHRTQK